MALGGTEWTITAGTSRVVVGEVGAALHGYTAGGVEVTPVYGPDELPPKGCGTTLVPWPNRIAHGRYDFDGETQQLALTEPDAGNAIHGLGRWARWTPVRQDAASLTLALDVVPQKGYPFEVRAEVTYALDGDGLTVTLTGRNTGRRRAPFGAGSHPFLSARGHSLDDVELTLPASEILDADDRGIPTGVRPVGPDEDFRRSRPLGGTRFDTGFTGLERVEGRAEAALRTPDGGARWWADDAFTHVQVFTVEALTPAGGGVALEPMSCAPDAFNSGAGLVVLEPGDAWTGRWGVAPL